jgi:hypothetical protein
MNTRSRVAAEEIVSLRPHAGHSIRAATAEHCIQTARFPRGLPWV